MQRNLKKEFAKLELNYHQLPAEKIYPLVDLTLLDENASEEDIRAVYKEATSKDVAGICLYPMQLGWLPEKTFLKRVTVVNFPAGNFDTLQVLSSIDDAINIYAADEIDYVFPYQQYLSQDETAALKSCQAAFDVCQKYNTTFKVIIESGAFTNMQQIYKLSSELLTQGCDFIKTSTGKFDIGASFEAVYAILTAICDTNCKSGIKISGGVRNYDAASRYIKLAEKVLDKPADPSWFRIGTSGLTNS